MDRYFNRGELYVSGGFYYSDKFAKINEFNKPLYNLDISLLGLVGETVKGPAFQPIFITNYTDSKGNDFTATDVFLSVFGDNNNNELYENNNLRYELSYIARRYLESSNQLFVTRVLGLSGYNAGKAWAITLKANVDESTLTTGSTVNEPSLFTLVYDSDNKLQSFSSDNSDVQSLISNGSFDGSIETKNFVRILGTILLNNLNSTIKSINVLTSEDLIIKTGVTLSTVTMVDREYDISTGTTGVFSGYVSTISAKIYDDVEDTVVAILRSKGAYADEILNFEISGGTSTIGFNSNLISPLNTIDDDISITGKTNGVLSNITDYNSSAFDIMDIVNVFGNNPKGENKTPIFVSEFYPNTLNSLIKEGKVKNIKYSLVEYGDKFSNYKQRYKKPESPWIVSQIFGSNIFRLFRCLSLTDGESGNNQIKITITNIDLKEFTFDLVVRDINNSDDSFQFIENHVGCSMNPSSANFIGKMIGTLNGDYPQQSSFITIELSDDYDFNNSVPAGFLGYPIKDYTDTVSGVAKNPFIKYKTQYKTNNKNVLTDDDKDKVSLGFCKYSDVLYGDKIETLDLDMFKHIGATYQYDEVYWTGLTNGFHLDVNANSATVDNFKFYKGNNEYYVPVIKFDTGVEAFDSEDVITLTSTNNYYNKKDRKFTFVLYGGYDGWDIYRDERTFGDVYQYGKNLGDLGYNYGNFNKYSSNNSKYAITSDYYAFLDGIATYRNPDETPINLFATPGIDLFKNTNLVEYTIDLIEDKRPDFLYLPTLPDTDNGNDRLLVDDVIDTINNEFDTTYAAVYWPWIRGVYDTNIFMPPTGEVVRLMAEAGYLFRVVSGTQYGDLGLSNETIEVRDIDRGDKITVVNNGIIYNTNNVLTNFLTKEEMNLLYANRINPIYTIPTGNDKGVYLWGNKTLQNIYTERNIMPQSLGTEELYMSKSRSRISIRRLLLYLRTLVINKLKKDLFDSNDNKTKSKVQIDLDDLLKDLKNKGAIDSYTIELDELTKTMDSYTLSGKIYIKPFGSLEYIEFLFDVTDNEQTAG